MFLFKLEQDTTGVEKGLPTKTKALQNEPDVSNQFSILLTSLLSNRYLMLNSKNSGSTTKKFINAFRILLMYGYSVS